MKFNRTKNVSRTFGFGVFSKIIMIVCPFVTRTIIIYKLGAEYVGLTSLFTSVLNILNVTELGISSAISFCLYKPIADDDIPTINALMALMKKIYRLIGCFILCGGLAIMPFLNNIICGDYPSSINIYSLYFLYLLNAAVSYFGFAYKSILFEAYQEGYTNHKIIIAVEIIKYVLQISILLTIHNYYWYVAVLPVSSILVTIITEIASRKLHPDIVPGGHVSEEIKNVLKKKVVFLAAHSFASKLITSVDTIVISGALGLIPIAIYGNYQYIYSAIFSFVLILYQALKPIVGNSYHTDNAEKQFLIFRTLRLVANWVCTWCSVCLLCLYQPFMTLWVGNDYLLALPVVVMFVLFFYSNAIRQFYTSTYIEAVGLWNKTLVRQLVAAGINLVLDVILVKQFAIFGIIFASFITNAFIAYPLDIVVTYKYVFKSNSRNGLVNSIKSFMVSVLVCLPVWFVCSQIHIDGILGLICKGLICLVLPNIEMILLNYRREEFGFILQHIKGVISKNTK